MAKHRPEHHAEPILESAMDYAQHEATYNGFLSLLKYVLIAIAILVVGLYAAIIAGQMALGLVLVVASVVVPVTMAVISRG